MDLLAREPFSRGQVAKSILTLSASLLVHFSSTSLSKNPPETPQGRQITFFVTIQFGLRRVAFLKKSSAKNFSIAPHLI